MRTHATTRTTTILLVALLMILPAAAASDVQQGTILLSGTRFHHGDTLTITAKVNVAGDLDSLTFVFQGANTTQTVSVSDNLTQVNSTQTYRVQRLFDGSEAFDHYVLHHVVICDDDGCASDSSNLTDAGGRVPSFDLVALPPPPPALPDLVAEGLNAASNHTVACAGHVLVHGLYANRGNATASGFAVTLSVDNSTLAQDTGVSLDAGHQGAISADWDATPGFHTLRLVVDDGNAVAESNEANNVLTTQVLVVPCL